MAARRLAIITTHPIQYYAPLFALLAQRNNIDVKVFYTWGEDVMKDKYDPGFGRVISWDIPLLEGYEYQFEKNVAADKGSHHNKGIINPHLVDDISGWRADAILLIGWNYDSHLKAMKYFKGKIPVYFRGDSTLLDEASGMSLKTIARRLGLRWIYKNIDKAFYVGAHNKAYFKAAGLKEEQLIYAPHAINNEWFGSNALVYEREAAQWREQLKIDKGEIVFLFAGKLESKKDPVLLVKAFLALRIEGAHLVIAGNGELDNDLKNIAAGNTAIHFLDFQNQSKMPIVYRLGDVYVLPSQGPGETWGLAINEAMASSRAVLASRKCGGAIDLIKDNENGYIFNAGSEEQLRDYMHRMIEAGQQKIKEMGRKGAEIITGFTYTRIVKAIETEVSSIRVRPVQ